MLREITWDQLAEWRTFAELEPIDRNTYQLAQIAQLIWNVNRDTKRSPKGLGLGEFILDFDPKEKPKQSAEYIERILTAWIDVNNAIWRNEHPEENGEHNVNG